VRQTSSGGTVVSAGAFFRIKNVLFIQSVYLEAL